MIKKWSDIPTIFKGLATVFGGLAAIAIFFHQYAHAGGKVALIQHIEDFNGLLVKLENQEKSKGIREATANINFIDQKLDAGDAPRKLEATLLRQRGEYVELRQCIRDERPVCE